MTRILAILALILAALPAVAAPDLQDLLNSFGGNFDSKMQWEMEDHADLLERDRHPWTTVVHTGASIPDLGANVFYVEEFRGGNPEKVVRQRIVSFAQEPDTIRMRQYVLKTPAQFRGARRAPEKLAALKPDDLTPIDGCDVVWRYDRDEFWVGEIPGKTCLVLGQGRPRYVQYRVTLTWPLYQRVDRELYVDTDGLAAGFADELPTVHARTRFVP